ncbi:MAG: hypothetical protein ACSLFL_14130 [Alphaproteobacteria bacterium]
MIDHLFGFILIARRCLIPDDHLRPDMYWDPTCRKDQYVATCVKGTYLRRAPPDRSPARSQRQRSPECCQSWLADPAAFAAASRAATARFARTYDENEARWQALLADLTDASEAPAAAVDGGATK